MMNEAAVLLFDFPRLAGSLCRYEFRALNAEAAGSTPAPRIVCSQHEDIFCGVNRNLVAGRTVNP